MPSHCTHKDGALAFRLDIFRWPVPMVTIAEFALAAALVLQGVRLLWALVTPAGALGMPPPSQPQAKADFAVLSRVDPFFRGLDSAGDARAFAATGIYTLFGVRTGAAGRGSAILAGPDGRQEAYTVGQAIAPGTVLTAVGADHAVVSRAGVHIRIAFQPPSSLGAPSAPIAPAAPIVASGGGTITPKSFLSQTAFQPRLQDGQVLGYTVAPRDSGQALQQAGLQAGDVIRTINGSALSRNRFEEIESEFSGSDQVELTVERGGQIITKNLRVTQ